MYTTNFEKCMKKILNTIKKKIEVVFIYSFSFKIRYM